MNDDDDVFWVWGERLCARVGGVFVYVVMMHRHDFVVEDRIAMVR